MGGILNELGDLELTRSDRKGPTPRVFGGWLSGHKHQAVLDSAERMRLAQSPLLPESKALNDRRRELGIPETVEGFNQWVAEVQAKKIDPSLEAARWLEDNAAFMRRWRLLINTHARERACVVIDGFHDVEHVEWPKFDFKACEASIESRMFELLKLPAADLAAVLVWVAKWWPVAAVLLEDEAGN